MKHDPRDVAYLRRWETLGPLLEKLRAEEIRKADTITAIQLFDTAFKVAMRDLPPRQTSGLVEWQKVMKKWRERG